MYKIYTNTNIHTDALILFKYLSADIGGHIIPRSNSSFYDTTKIEINITNTAELNGSYIYFSF